MSEIGKIGWIDLTVKNCDEVKNFYSKVTGWQVKEFNMGTYNDYIMETPFTNEAVAGICNALGGNSDFPPAWIIYINIENLEKSLSECKLLGGEILLGPKEMPGSGKYALIKDPAGAVSALFEKI